MAWFPISNIVPQYYNPDTDKPYSGAVLKAYQVGTLTNIALATDNTGGTTANSIALNASGYPEVSGSIVIPHIDQDYKLALYPDQASADADSGADWTIDNIDVVQSGSPYQVETATDGGTDAFDSATNTSAPSSGQVVRRDFQSSNSTTAPTLDGITIKNRDGSALDLGAINGIHDLEYDGTDYLLRDPFKPSEPEHATDSGTDTYVSATNTGTPVTGTEIKRDFQSANTTTTPALDGVTIKTRDGSALWAGAIDGPHRLKYDGTDYLLLDPIYGQAVTGADGTVVTGTAGTDGNAAQWNSDGDLVDGPNPATQAEQEAGSTNTAYVTPGRQHHHPSAAKAWANFGVTGSANASYNVSSITDSGTGDAEVNLSTAFSSVDYAILTDVETSTNEYSHVNTHAAGSFGVQCRNTGTGNQADPDAYFVAAFGDQ